MRILFIGDIVGKPGRVIVEKTLAGLIREHSLDLVVANAENSAGGSGLSPDIYRKLIAAGVDGITLGDHIYRRREIRTILESEPNIVKPGNYPEEAAGKTMMTLTSRGGYQVAVISLMGRMYMRPTDCPWHAADRILKRVPANVKTILVDFHAEATSEKQLMGRYLDGRVTAVLGTHTHVPTADECILPGGTAFQCDVGMTGPYDSILGRRVDRVTEATLTFNPAQFDVATEDLRIGGTMVTCDPKTGRATAIERLRVREDDIERLIAAGKA